ncbi:hypothetical protein [Thioclava sp. F28-4]|uniref:hypothetical protein n=1 Tax=Thioclava sp. F28-4 TaxID=1915315 RepID=UPI001439278E|nr:hypothetical protein [Thioclava sp. F28-4]
MSDECPLLAQTMSCVGWLRQIQLVRAGCSSHFFLEGLSGPKPDPTKWASGASLTRPDARGKQGAQILESFAVAKPPEGKRQSLHMFGLLDIEKLGAVIGGPSGEHLGEWPPGRRRAAKRDCQRAFGGEEAPAMIELSRRVGAPLFTVEIFKRRRDFGTGIGETCCEDREVVARARGGENVEHGVVLCFLSDLSLAEAGENLGLKKLKNPAVWSNYVDNSGSHLGKPRNQREQQGRTPHPCFVVDFGYFEYG